MRSMMICSSAFTFAVSLFNLFWCSNAASNPSAYLEESGLKPCPVSCEFSGPDAANWTRYHDTSFLTACDRKPKLLDYIIHNPRNSTRKLPPVVRACTSFRGKLVFEAQFDAYDKIMNDKTLREITVTPSVYSQEAKHKVITPQFITAIKEIQASLLFDQHDETDATSVTVHYGHTVVGVHVGAAINKPGAAVMALHQLIEFIRAPEALSYSTLSLQICGSGRPSDYILGVFADNTPGEAFEKVRSALAAWRSAACIAGVGEPVTFNATTLWNTNSTVSAQLFNATNSTGEFLKNSFPSTHLSHRAAHLQKRADCRTVQVVSGDSCGALATKCGISGASFTQFNPGSTFCSTLRVGQRACCSSGNLPDVRPKPNADGSCASYLVKAGDWCDSIAATNGLTVNDLESLNKNTWGWSGCTVLYAGINMCLSSGSPPMPAPIENAVCGPQKPGTAKPASGTNIADLNPCPLKACCNVWGQCGTTADFCIKSSLGPPGTSQPGKNGCISNCGTDIVKGSPPSQFIKLGYFEAWNKKERPCLHMDVTQIDSSYTHIHFAFGDVTPQFTVSVAPVQEQFDKFVKMKGAKRVLAFGGWTASTSPNSYYIFREGVKPGNREVLATNLAKFINDKGLDGIDLDWEYPGAPDIPGIPSADPIDGNNYLELLKLLRNKLPNKSLSIAAPASFWYLKPFPIAEIAKVVDYIVYMTYDLHGQWDYGSQWASVGCPNGNCLRSHVNLTETLNSLSMVTKAGVPSNKLIIGVSSYGRSFRMVDPSCTGPQCKFVGPESAATKGECTGTAGYISNAEIDKIIANGAGKTSFDRFADSDILVYGSDWVAYMSEATKAKRTSLYKSFNFGGTTDWAVDLAKFMPATGDGNNIPALPQEGDDEWKSIDCNHELARNETADPIKRWDDLKCKDAWDSAISAWKNQRSTGKYIFSSFMSSHLNGPTDMECEKLSSVNGCTDTVECSKELGRNPAGALILRGFMKVNKLYWSFYDGVRSAANTFDLTINDFSETFAPEQEADESMDWLFAFLGTGLGMVGGPMFERVFSSTRFFVNNPTAQESLKETVMAGVEMGLSKASDAVKKGTVLKPLTNELGVALSYIVQNWKALITASTAETFSGSDEGIEYLRKLINQNKILNTEVEASYDVEHRALRALYAYIIPYAWSLRGIHPVLIDDGFSCDDVGSGDYKHIFPDDNEKAAACVNNRNYFLLSPQGHSIRCVPWGNRETRCEEQAMTLVNGYESLGETGDFGQEKWGGITRSDIVKSILTRYAIKGNRDLDRPADATNPGGHSQLWDQINGGDIVSLPGVVQIPKCGQKEVADNWKRATAGQKMDYVEYPCNKS